MDYVLLILLKQGLDKKSNQTFDLHKLIEQQLTKYKMVMVYIANGCQKQKAYFPNTQWIISFILTACGPCKIFNIFPFFITPLVKA